MITIIKADGKAEQERIAAMRTRAAEVGADIELAVSAIMENVKENGLAAVEDYSRRFDHKVPYEIGPEKLTEAYERCPKDLIAAMERAAANIRAYNERLLVESREWTSPDGGVVGRVVRGLTRVGIYVPGGTAAYPSSVLMNAIPAKVAGVEEIVMVTPPTENLNDAVLAAAKIAGVDRCIAVGGQTVDINDEDGLVYVDGVALREPYTDGLPTYTLASDVSYPYTVPEGMMWMMGDNRTNSQDSRYFGAVSVASAEARSVAVLWPLGDVGLLG